MDDLEHYLGVAHRASTSARRVGEQIRLGDMIMAQGHTLGALRALEELLVWLTERVAEMPRGEWEQVGNPYPEVLMDGPVSERRLSRLSLDELIALCRNTSWKIEHDPHPHGRWFLEAELRLAERELRHRKYDPERWKRGTEWA